MKNITFDAPLGLRNKRRYILGITVWSSNLWWVPAWGRWAYLDEINGKEAASSSCPCSSYKAFISHLKRHNNSLLNEHVILVSRLYNNDIHYNKPKS